MHQFELENNVTVLILAFTEERSSEGNFSKLFGLSCLTSQPPDLALSEVLLY